MGYGFGPPPGYNPEKGKSKKESKPTQEAPKKNVKRRSQFRLLDAQLPVKVIANQEITTKERPKTKQFIGYPGFFGPGFGYGSFIYPGFGFGYPGFLYPGFGYPFWPIAQNKNNQFKK